MPDKRVYSEEERREKKNARQREYAKRTGYAANQKYMKCSTKVYSFRFMINTESDIIEYLEKQENKAGYIKQLIRDDMNK